MTTDLPRLYAELASKGVKFIDVPRALQIKSGRALFTCLYDPDGTIIELIEYLPSSGSSKAI